MRVAAFVFGVGLGGDYMIIPLMAAELFGVRRLGRVMGIVITADNVAEATAPMAVAAIRDHAGSYGPGFALLVGLAVVGAAAVALLPAGAKRPRGAPGPPTEPHCRRRTESPRTLRPAPAGPGFTSNPGPEKMEHRWQRTPDRPSTSASERPARRKSRPPRRSVARSAPRRRSSAAPEAGADDPDIAGIVPGPQPLPWDDEEPSAS